MDIKDKTIVITGVSKGIGLALLREFLNEGAKVVGMGQNRPEIENSNFLFIKTDVRSEREVAAAFEQLFDTWGQQVDVMINNAGLGRFDAIEAVNMDEMRQMFETNVYSIFYTSKAVVPVMKAKGEGHIFNISSTAGLESYPGASAYCGTKFAVKAISGSMYKEIRDYGVKVTCVYPGSVKTNFFDTHQTINVHDYMLRAEDVAEMIVHAAKTPKNFHQVNLEVRPLQPKGPIKV